MSDDVLRQNGTSQDDIVWLEKDPDDFAFRGLLTAHGSLPNTFDQDRVFQLLSYVKADTTDRGDCLLSDGPSVPLDPVPRQCKFEGLQDNPDYHYVQVKWFC